MEGFNSFEYSAEQKCEGKWVLFKILLILGYVIFAAAYFVVIFITRIIPVGALIPFFLWILVFLTWKYLSPDYKYTIETGTFTFYVEYSAKKKTRPKTSFKISEAQAIIPMSDSEDAVKAFAPDRVYFGVPSKNTPDVFVALYRDREGKKCALYFAAAGDAFRLLKLRTGTAQK